MPESLSFGEFCDGRESGPVKPGVQILWIDAIGGNSAQQCLGNAQLCDSFE